MLRPVPNFSVEKLMKMMIWKASALALSLGVLPGPLLAQDDAKEAAPAAEFAEEAPYVLPAELDDAPFAQYVDISLLGQAWAAKDAALLTDLALQLASGERILLRAHKAGSSRDLLGLAVKVAQSADDKAALERVAQAAGYLKYDDIVAMTKSSGKLAGASRKDEPALSVSVDQMPAEGFAAYGWLVNQVRSVELLGDKAALDAIEKWSESATGLTEAQKTYLKTRMSEIRNQPEDPSLKSNKFASTISKLEGNSRGDDAYKAAAILHGIGSIVNGPSYGGPSYGRPSYGGPSYGSPSYGGPSYGRPSYGGPSYGGPSYGTPSYGRPSYGGPSYGTPSYGRPSYGGPSYGGPSYGRPSYGPSYGGRSW